MISGTSPYRVFHATIMIPKSQGVMTPRVAIGPTQPFFVSTNGQESDSIFACDPQWMEEGIPRHVTLNIRVVNPFVPFYQSAYKLLH